MANKRERVECLTLALALAFLAFALAKVRAGYEELLKKLLDRSDGVSLDEAVEANYEQCDIQFLTLLNQKVGHWPGDAYWIVCEG